MGAPLYRWMVFVRENPVKKIYINWWFGGYPLWKPTRTIVGFVLAQRVTKSITLRLVQLDMQLMCAIHVAQFTLQCLDKLAGLQTWSWWNMIIIISSLFPTLPGFISNDCPNIGLFRGLKWLETSWNILKPPNHRLREDHLAFTWGIIKLGRNSFWKIFFNKLLN